MTQKNSFNIIQNIQSKKKHQFRINNFNNKVVLNSNTQVKQLQHLSKLSYVDIPPLVMAVRDNSAFIVNIPNGYVV